MNRTMTSLVVLGIGAAAISMTRGNNNIMNGKAMKQMRKRIAKAIY